jgi:hypothetical protein
MARATTPSLPLTSLTQVGTRATGVCSACGSDRLTRIDMTLTDGSPVEFAHCLHCEHREWVQAGKPLTLRRVLNKARKNR